MSPVFFDELLAFVRGHGLSGRIVANAIEFRRGGRVYRVETYSAARRALGYGPVA